MTFTIVILIGIVCLLVLYILLLHKQLKNINRQLNKRLSEHTRQPVSLQLISSCLNELTANINKSLKAEETLRLEMVREEKNFKELIANISHDLRTPLTAIKGYQQLMEQHELSADQSKRLHIARKYADELGILIEHFFEYSYLVNADLKFELTTINLTHLLTECLANSVSSFEAHNLMVRFEEAPSIFILANQEMVMRIIRNLIGNCLAHSQGDVTVWLTTADHAVLSFQNPVDPAAKIDINSIFDRFYTGDPVRSKTTGLGLSIVKLLAEQMGGSVNASLQNQTLLIQVKFPL